MQLRILFLSGLVGTLENRSYQYEAHLINTIIVLMYVISGAKRLRVPLNVHARRKLSLWNTTNVQVSRMTIFNTEQNDIY